MNNKNTKNNKGFVVLFTVLIATVVLAMAVGITNIALKQIILSSSASEGNVAFYAADSGIECALANDAVFSSGGTSIDCNGFFGIGVLEFNNTYDFNISYGDSCAYIHVDKNPVPGSHNTTVISTGQNVPCNLADPDPRTVEREIEVRY